MISYAIDVAYKSNLFDQVFVSSEDNEILNISKALGAKTIERPETLADDFTPTVEVIANAIKQILDESSMLNYICCIYPAVPFLSPQYLIESYTFIQANDADYVFPVARFPSSILRAFYMGKNGILKSVDKEWQRARTQDIQEAYFDAGQFYWGEKNTWLSLKNIHENSYGYIIPERVAIDIDTPEDWYRAELMFKLFNLEKLRNSDV